MKFLRNFLDKKVEPHFVKGGKLERFYPIYEMFDTIGFTPGYVTKGLCHIRDGLDQKRLMITVVIALLLPILAGIYNIGYQANSLMFLRDVVPDDFRAIIMTSLGINFDARSILSNFIYGSLYFFPILIVTLTAGGIVEVICAVIRKHEVTEGFLVTAVLIPLTLPPTVPLWQVAVGTIFGVLIGKEIFGGVGFNFLNPALTTRAFLFFSYPVQMTGDTIWVAVDGVTKATPLGIAPLEGISGILNQGYTLWDSFLGFIPGSMGETSTLAILVGAFILILTGIGSWRIMLSVLIGMFIMSGFLFILHLQGISTNPTFSLNPLWHLVLGGFAFGTVYMATDPVSAAMTNMDVISMDF